MKNILQMLEEKEYYVVEDRTKITLNIIIFYDIKEYY